MTEVKQELAKFLSLVGAVLLGILLGKATKELQPLVIMALIIHCTAYALWSTSTD
jgi:hypothetical protein